MTLFAAIMLFLLQTFPAVQQPQQTQSAKSSIEGFVVRAGTNEPIARARINALRTAGPGGAPIQQSGPPQNIPAVTTDSQGHFAIKDLEPGSYSLTAQRNGFARQAYGARSAVGTGTPLNILAGQIIKGVVFRLNPAGAVSGRVTDATGEPLAGITIQIVRSAYDSNGKRTFQPVGSARTNDRGEYRAYWISPGRYYVSASSNQSPFDGFPRGPNSNEVVEPGFVPTYYPGTLDRSTASPIEVEPGAELSPIDFTLTQQPLFRIRGRAFDARTGQSLRNVNVSINPRNPATGFFVSSARTTYYNPANGTFELIDVSPGSYWVRAMALPDPGAGIGPADIGRNTAQVAVEVSNADVENVVLAFTPGFSIQGRIDLDGAPLSTLPDVQRIRVFLLSIEPMASNSPPQPIKADGTFTLQNIQPGDYRVLIFSMPPNTYMGSARLGRTDVLSGVSISGPVSEPLEILLSTKGGQIDGTIVDKEQKLMPGIQAVLIPDRQRDRRDLYKFGTSDQNGRFTMRTIAPGDYKIFAWDDLEPGAYNDPDFVRKYEALSTPVKVTESGKLAVEVKVIPQN